ncbi:MAG: 50S ribosomal protein L6 [Patescibacteria group bacterium]|nr:50S ribosomal protein L6 [Patescibacteria group bacterium]
MSRIGVLPVKIPQGVSIEKNGVEVVVKGPLGELKRNLPSGIEISLKDDEVLVTRKNDLKQTKALHGTTRSHIANMVVGVSKGWSKVLELVGTGYRAEVSGNRLRLNVGYSHPIEIVAPDGISFKVEKTDITISGFDKELVSQVAATIRSKRKPEPYKGKGIKYKNEVIRRKAGKASKASA